jgi:hypothetical protein
MKTSFKFKLILAVLMIASMSGTVYAVPFEQFANNIEEGRFILSEPWDFQGEHHDDYDVIVSGTTVHIPINRDPQLAILFSEFSVNSSDVFDALIDYALENVVFTQPLENFMGGSTLFGTSAFEGELHDASGNVIPNSQVGFGVFETISGEDFLTSIAFVSNVSDLIGDVSFVSNFEPVVPYSVSGTFTGTARGLYAYDFMIPEPATMTLLSLGGLTVLRRRKTV